MEKEKENNIYDFLLPEGMSEYFEVKSIEESAGNLILVLEEWNVYPEGLKDKKLESKGFTQPQFWRIFLSENVKFTWR